MAKEIILNIDLNAGDAPKTLSELETNLTQLKEKAKGVAVGSTEFKKLASEIRTADSQIKNLNKSLEGLDIDAIAGEMGKFAGGVGAAFAGVSALAVDADADMQEFIKTVGTGIVVGQGIKGAIEAWTSAQKLLNIAMAANPLGVVIAAVAVLATGIVYLTKVMGDNTDGIDENTTAYKNLKTATDDYQKFIKGQVKDLIDSRDELALLREETDKYTLAIAKLNDEEQSALATAGEKYKLEREALKKLFDEGEIGWDKYHSKLESLESQHKTNLGKIEKSYDTQRELALEKKTQDEKKAAEEVTKKISEELIKRLKEYDEYKKTLYNQAINLTDDIGNAYYETERIQLEAFKLKVEQEKLYFKLYGGNIKDIEKLEEELLLKTIAYAKTKEGIKKNSIQNEFRLEKDNLIESTKVHKDYLKNLEALEKKFVDKKINEEEYKNEKEQIEDTYDTFRAKLNQVISAYIVLKSEGVKNTSDLIKGTEELGLSTIEYYNILDLISKTFIKNENAGKEYYNEIDGLNNNHLSKFIDSELKKREEAKKTYEELSNLLNQTISGAEYDFKKAEEEKRRQLEGTASIAVELANAVSTSLLQINQARLDKELTAENKKIDAKQQAIDDAAEAGLLTELEYDVKSKAIEKERLQADFENRTKAFEYERKAALFQIAITTALNIVKASGLLVGAPLAIASAIAAGAAQALVVQTAPAPVPEFADGGLIGGVGNGTDDRTNIRVSPGESIINAKSTKQFAPILSTLNQLGGGSAIGGSTASLGMSDAQVSRIINGINDKKVINVATDTSKVSTKVKNIERNASF